MKMIKTLGLTLAATGLMTISVQALPSVSGDIFINASSSHATIDKSANTVTFVLDNMAVNNALVNNGTGDFVSLIGTFANYVNFTYSPLAVANPLWSTVGGAASFDLTSITTINEAGSGLSLTGLGIIHLAGFEDTAGMWSFSADTTDGVKFNFSSTTTTDVPDGGTTVLLLGAALSGLAWVNSRRK